MFDDHHYHPVRYFSLKAVVIGTVISGMGNLSKNCIASVLGSVSYFYWRSVPCTKFFPRFFSFLFRVRASGSGLVQGP